MREIRSASPLSVHSSLRMFVVVVACLVGSVSSQECFPWNGNAALKSAVNNYIHGGGPNSAAGRRYGRVLGNWCVRRVASLAGVFLNQATFNDPLTGWDTSNATSFARMFEGAASFNRPLGHFKTNKAITMDRMFFGAKKFQGIGLASWHTGKVQSFFWTFKSSAMNADISTWNMGSANDLRDMFRNTPYNKNLCLWGATLRRTNLPSTRVANMFASTSCAVKTSPTFASDPAGPLCSACPSWRWGGVCFEDGNELYDAVGVRSLFGDGD
jgi:hypothetical protein